MATVISGYPEDIYDGRHLRRRTNETRVLSAVLECFAEGNLSPTAAEVADRAGVSERSVFRYFSDTEEMAVAAVRFAVATAEARVDLDNLPEDLAERVTLFCRNRVVSYEMYGSVAMALGSRLHMTEAHALHLELNEGQARQTLAFFEADLERMDDAGGTLRSIEAMTSYDAYLMFTPPAEHAVDEMAAAVLKLLS